VRVPYLNCSCASAPLNAALPPTFWRALWKCVADFVQASLLAARAGVQYQDFHIFELCLLVDEATDQEEQACCQIPKWLSFAKHTQCYRCAQSVTLKLTNTLAAVTMTRLRGMSRLDTGRSFSW